MGVPAVSIPEKLFFKIGEVCEIVGVQAHVLRYWETEFPMFSPQKNRAGQRTYRKRDVEIALRIKELLYEDLYTIAGAKKRLTADLRNGGKLNKPFEAEQPTQTQTFNPQPQTQTTPQPRYTPDTEPESVERLRPRPPQPRIYTKAETPTPQPQTQPPQVSKYAPREVYQREPYSNPQPAPQRESYNVSQLTHQPAPPPPQRQEIRNEVTRLPLPTERKTATTEKQQSMSGVIFELRELLAMMDANDAEMKKLNRRR